MLIKLNSYTYKILPVMPLLQVPKIAVSEAYEAIYITSQLCRPI